MVGVPTSQNDMHISLLSEEIDLRASEMSRQTETNVFSSVIMCKNFFSILLVNFFQKDFLAPGLKR